MKNFDMEAMKNEKFGNKVLPCSTFDKNFTLSGKLCIKLSTMTKGDAEYKKYVVIFLVDSKGESFTIASKSIEIVRSFVRALGIAWKSINLGDNIFEFDPPKTVYKIGKGQSYGMKFDVDILDVVE